MERINIAEKFARISEQWQPKMVAELNSQEKPRFSATRPNLFSVGSRPRRGRRECA
jgi:hypothetical protein